MLEPPRDLTAEVVTRMLRDYWELPPTDVAYEAAGHGSHNWTATATTDAKWFIKADRGTSTTRTAAYLTAANLRDNGLDFVHAAIPDRCGELRRRVGAWEMSVFPFINGRNPDFTNTTERAQIAEVIGELHRHLPIPATALRWTAGVGQSELIHLLDLELDQPWTHGPYAARAQALVRDNLSGIRELLSLHHQLTDRLHQSDRPWVITHGEPHGGNTMIDNLGQVHLIDCDDLMLSPAERDLWLLLHIGHQRPLTVETQDILTAYHQADGPTKPRRYVIELMRADWHLMEISSYAQDFSQPHEDSRDLDAHWQTLNSYLPTEQNWPPSPRRFDGF